MLPLLCSVVAIPLFSYLVNRGSDHEGFHRILIQLYFFIIVPVMCISQFGAMIRDELQDDTMTFLITRPLSRAKIYLLKYVTVCLWVQLIVLGNAIAFWAVGLVLGVSDLGTLMPRMIVVQALAVMAYGALSGVFGLLTQKYMILGVVYGFIVEFGIGQIPTNINVLSLNHHLQSLLARDESLKRIYDWTAESASSGLSMVFVGTTLLFLVIGTLLFNFREYHHADEMQKGGA